MAAGLSPLARALRAFMRTNLRGTTRIPNVLASTFSSLHSVPIVIHGLSPVYVDLRDGHSHYLLRDSPYESPPYEQREQQTFRTVLKGGDTVFDVGANLGFHLVVMARLVGRQGRVFAFEPNPHLRMNLERTVSHLSNTTLFPCALSDEQGEMTFFIPEDHMLSSLGDWTKEPGARQVKCRTERIDDLVGRGVLPVPNFIKCDVEGAEIRVFTGAEETLNRASAPVILFEADIRTVKGLGVPVTAAFDFLASLKKARYQFFEQLDDGYGAMEHLHEDHANILAVPDSKLSDYAAVVSPPSR